MIGILLTHIVFSFFCRNLILWSYKQRQTVTRCSIEAKYKSLTNTTVEIQWLQSLLGELHVPCSQKPIQWCGNIGATYLASNPLFHA